MSAASSDLCIAADTIADADEPEADTPVDDDVQTRTVGDTLYKSALTFEQLNLSPQLLEGLYTEMKFSQPSRIQGITLPLILNPPNRSLIAQVSAHLVRRFVQPGMTRGHCTHTASFTLSAGT